MPRSRTARVLLALFVSMVTGSLMLMMLETEPLRPPAAPLAALAPPEADPSIPIYEAQRFDRLKWRNVVIHSSTGSGKGIASRCHFLVGRRVEGRCKITATDLWKRQVAGRHIDVPGQDFNAISVGICIVGDFSRQPPSPAQLDALVRLVRALQQEFAIRCDHVYLRSDLVPDSASPGRAFPARRFSRLLLQP